MLNTTREWVKRRLGRPTHAAHRPQTGHLERTFEETGAELHAIDLGAASLASTSKRLGLDVLLPSMQPLPASVGVPWIGYLFDFQHRHLPHFFSPAERANRDAAFERMLREARCVIVNAQDVARDVRLFYPGSTSRLFALPFSTAPGKDWFDQDPAATAMRYGVTHPYFIICNQFWKHKDHATAFKAFVEVAQRYPRVSLVCTGATNDYRYPGHFEELMSNAQRAGFVDRIHVLGLIPKLDQVALIRGSIALIQPTLFEGGPGGGAVYDSVSLGAPSIVSDIAVNREISEPTVTYFKASDPGSLAEAMDVALRRPATHNADPAELFRQGHERRIQCGRYLREAIDFAMSAKR